MIRWRRLLHWIERLTQWNFRLPFHQEIKDGVVLCQLINMIKPDTIKKVHTDTKVVYRHIENIKNFIDSAIAFGVRPSLCFDSLDLYEFVDIGKVVTCIHALSDSIQTTLPEFKGPYLIKDSAGFNHAATTHLKIIVAVSDFRRRNRGQAGVTGADMEDQSEEDDMINEAIDCKLAMMGIEDNTAANAHIETATEEQTNSFIRLYSSTTKSSSKMEGDERRLIYLLKAKAKKYEMIYVDVTPGRRDAMFSVSESYDLPQVHVFVEEEEEEDSEYQNLGSIDDLQILEDDGMLDQYLEDAPEGEGYWIMPKDWGHDSKIMGENGTGTTVVNTVEDMVFGQAS